MVEGHGYLFFGTPLMTRITVMVLQESYPTPRKICGREDHGYRYYYTYYCFSNAIVILQCNYRKQEPNTSFFKNKEKIVQRVSLWRMRVSCNETHFD